MDLVDLHYKECPIEEITFSTMMSKGPMRFMMPRRVRASISKLEILKMEHPEQSDAIDEKIKGLYKRLELLEDPLKAIWILQIAECNFQKGIFTKNSTKPCIFDLA